MFLKDREIKMALRRGGIAIGACLLRGSMIALCSPKRFFRCIPRKKTKFKSLYIIIIFYLFIYLFINTSIQHALHPSLTYLVGSTLAPQFWLLCFLMEHH